MEMRTDLVAAHEKVSKGILPGQLQANVVVTTIVFSFDGAKLRLLACKVGDELDVYRLPSLAFDFSEDLASCAREVIRTRLPLDLSQMYQVGAFEGVGPESAEVGRQIEICYFTIASPSDLEFVATGALSQLRFIEVFEQAELLELHSREIAQAAISELRRRSRFETVVFSFLAHEFSLSELQRVFEAVLNRPMDVRNFRKKIESLDILVESAHRPRGMAYRPPRMFSFEPERFRHRQTLDGEVRFY
ncbi:MAG: NrtR DNA-binding winged helix domain-containing protein [Silvanigrellaceae bacterium]